VSARGDERAVPAALIVARAPSDAAALAGLAPLLDAPRRQTLQAVLIQRAAAWAAAAAAPGAAYVAVTPADRVAEVAALLPPGVTAIPGEDGGPAAAIARVGRAPLLVAGAECPRLGPAHARAALDDLAAGCDLVFGATLDGGWYLAALREPRPELLAVASERFGGLGPVLRRARELDAEVGMLRHERVLATPADAAAMLADPLLPAELRAALSA
jgi:uncharacterized protein